MEYVLGIDIGGTSIKAGLFTPAGELLEVRQVKTPELVNDAAFAVVTRGLEALLDEVGATPADVVAMGLDVPGPVDDDHKVGVLPNISLDAEGLQEALRAAFPTAKLAFVNDANAAVLGEAWQGGAKGANSCVMITLGTGVGGGVVCNGKLVAGAFGAGGEIGHITMNYDERRTCGCGRRGCLEQYASAKGVVRLYREACERAEKTPVKIEHDTDSLSVFNALNDGDYCAEQAVGTMVEYLGRACAVIACVVDPEVFLIGGGMAGGFGTFAESLRTSFRTHAFPASVAARIEPATLGNQAGMYGAAYCALTS